MPAAFKHLASPHIGALIGMDSEWMARRWLVLAQETRNGIFKRRTWDTVTSLTAEKSLKARKAKGAGPSALRVLRLRISKLAKQVMFTRLASFSDANIN